jgi:putative ABC transport system permease protein
VVGVSAFLRDLTHALRLQRKNLPVTVLAALSLGLGIGASSAMFQLIDAIQLEALPVPRPSELLELRIANPDGMRGIYDPEHPGLTNHIWEGIKAEQTQIGPVFAWSASRVDISPSAEAHYVRALFVSGRFFSALDVQPVTGRFITDADDQRGCPSVPVVLSHRFWTAQFAGSPDAVGTTLSIEGNKFTIVGVAQKSFWGIETGKAFDIAIPLCADSVIGRNRLDAPAFWWLTVMSRLKAPMPLSKLNGFLAHISPGIFSTTLPPQYPRENIRDYLNFRLTADPAERGFSQIRLDYSTALLVLFSISAIVFVIGCANMAALLLVRANARQYESAMRVVLGASRRSLMGQVLCESVILVVFALSIGMIAARLLVGIMVSFLEIDKAGGRFDLGITWSQVIFVIAAGVISCALSALPAMLSAAGTNLAMLVRTGSRTTGPKTFTIWANRCITSSQLALSFGLVLSAMCFAITIKNLIAVDLGFDDANVLVCRLNFSRSASDAAKRLQIRNDVLESLRSKPGVQAAAESAFILGDGDLRNQVWLDGGRAASGIVSRFNFVSPSYFDTLRVPLIGGRDFNRHDGPDGLKVVIVNAAFIQAMHIKGSPLGMAVRRQATPFGPETSFVIVGVVGNTKYNDAREDFLPIVYVPTSQDLRWTRALILIRVRS